MPNTWQDFFPKIELPANQWAVWETLHEPSIIRKAMAQLAVKRMKMGGKMDLDYMVKFASAVMNRLEREAEARHQMAPPVTVPVTETEEINGNR